MPSLDALLASYDANAPLEEAHTLRAPFYLDPRVAELEDEVLARTWHVAARRDQLIAPGDYATTRIGRESVVVVRAEDGVLRAMLNVCRHHAAEVMTGCGRAAALRCPYHGWTYGLDGTLRGVTEFQGVRNFERSDNGLVQVEVDEWESFVFVRIAGSNANANANERSTLREHLGSIVERVAPLELGTLHFVERREWELRCNWKVFVDNYLDGGYHVPHLHRGLASVLDYNGYTIENGERHCHQWSPMKTGADASVSAVRKGDRAHYFWLYPNFMINWYAGTMDTNLVVPLAIDRCKVVFDFYFEDASEAARARNTASIDVGRTVQDEDIAVCESVQRGLASRAYGAGRLSARREAGEHLFHRLLHADLLAAQATTLTPLRTR